MHHHQSLSASSKGSFGQQQQHQHHQLQQFPQSQPPLPSASSSSSRPSDIPPTQPRSTSRSSSHASAADRGIQIGLSLTPAHDRIFDACAATAAFFLFAQRNLIQCLNHDTLDVERTFAGHAHDVVWIETDNHSQAGAGKMVASYDSRSMTIIWDLLTGRNIAKLEPYGDIRVATWMRNGTIAFGNSQGNITLFEPNTKENMTIRTIFTPITALSPALDCQTFAIGYINGTILVAGLTPTFNILHTLNTQRAPSPINCLGWHGSSRSDMLASQTMDGDLRVWSIPRGSQSDPPAVIRHFDQGEIRPVNGPCWFAWSKAGRIIQYSDGITTSWDVRTKKVTYDSVPTVEGVIGIANFGPHAVLFTVGRNHTVQQYDLNPEGTPMLIRNVQHMPPAVVPPSPPTSDHQTRPLATTFDRNRMPMGQGSRDDSDYRNPAQRVATHLDQRAEPHPDDMSEEDDVLAPLSPVSSAASSRSSVRQNHSKSKRKVPAYPTRYDRSASSSLRPTTPGLSIVNPKTPSTSFSSASSAASRSRRPDPQPSSRLRNIAPEPPAEKLPTNEVFPCIKERLLDIQFRPPRYPEGQRSPDYLRQELLRCIFGWDGEVDDMIRYEILQHETSSTIAVLLSKWLGELRPDLASAMMGESMSSSDWMLLALSTVGGDSQKKIGDAFVQRLLERGEVHPAVAILLGLGEHNEAIEIYVSQGHYMEAVILACLVFPNDWGRVSHLTRLWGEQAIEEKKPHSTELAVRCFACTSVESNEPWFSPRAKDAVYEAQMRILGPDLSPHSETSQDPNGPKRQLSLLPKLTTEFGKTKEPKPYRSAARSAFDGKTPTIGYTPMDTSRPETARTNRWIQEPMSSVTATPGGLTSRRLTSRDRSRDPFSGLHPPSAIKTRQDDYLNLPSAGIRSAYGKSPKYMPSPAAKAFSQENLQSIPHISRERKPENIDTNNVYVNPALSTGYSMPYTEKSSASASSPWREQSAPSSAYPYSNQRAEMAGIDQYMAADKQRSDHRQTTRTRGASRSGATPEVRYVPPPKRSPSSPVSMSPDDPLLQNTVMHNRSREMAETEPLDPEKYYRMASPTSVSQSAHRERVTSPIEQPPSGNRGRSSSRVATSKKEEPTDWRRAGRGESRNPETGGRGRSRIAEAGASRARSPTSPVPMMLGSHDDQPRSGYPPPNEDHRQVRSRDESRSTRKQDDLRSARPRDESRATRPKDEESRSARSRDQSIGARVRARGTSAVRNTENSPERHRSHERSTSVSVKERRAESPPRSAVSAPRTMSRTRRPSIPRLQTNFPESDPRKTQAAQELEARRRSLANRPSARNILHPNEIVSPRQIDENMVYGQQSGGMDGPRPPTSHSHSSSNIPIVPMGLPSNPKVTHQANQMAIYMDDEALQNSQNESDAATSQPQRSASVPVERMNSQTPSRHVSRESTGRPAHNRMASASKLMSPLMSPPPPPPAAAVMGDEEAVILRSSISFLGGDVEHDGPSVILPELQHLNSPHPPKPTLGVINIGMVTPTEPKMSVGGGGFGNGLSSAAYQPPGVTSPTTSRRGRGSLSSSDANRPRGLSRQAGSHSQDNIRVSTAPPLMGGHERTLSSAAFSTANSLMSSNNNTGGGGGGGGLTLLSTVYNPTVSPANAGGLLSTLGAAAYNPVSPSAPPGNGNNTSNLNVSSPTLQISSGGGGGLATLGSIAYAPPSAPLPSPGTRLPPSTMAGYRTPKEIARAVQQQQQQQDLQFSAPKQSSYGGMTGQPF